MNLYISLKSNQISLPSKTNTNLLVRKQAEKSSKKINELYIQLFNSKKIYDAILQYKIDNKEEYETCLNKFQKKSIDKIIKDYERNGVQFKHERRQKIKTLQTTVSQLQEKLSSCVNNENKKVKFNLNELDGLSEDDLRLMKKEGDSYMAALKRPEYNAIMRNCNVEKTRETFNGYFESRCMDKHKDTVEKLILERYRLAKLLDFKSHADSKLQTRMANNVKKLQTFLSDLTRKVIHGVENE
jgi:thimet oligopeptidase